MFFVGLTLAHLQIGLVILAQPTKLNPRMFARTSGEERLSLPRNCWPDFGPGAAGGQLVTTKEVPTCLVPGRRAQKQRDLISGKITWAPDSSSTWRWHTPWPFLLNVLFCFPLSYFELGFLSVIIEQILVDKEVLKDTKEPGLEVPRRNNPGARSRARKILCRTEFGHWGTQRKQVNLEYNELGDGMKWDRTTGRNSISNKVGEREAEKHFPIYPL